MNAMTKISHVNVSLAQCTLNTRQQRLVFIFGLCHHKPGRLFKKTANVVSSAQVTISALQTQPEERQAAVPVKYESCGIHRLQPNRIRATVWPAAESCRGPSRSCSVSSRLCTQRASVRAETFSRPRRAYRTS